MKSNYCTAMVLYDDDERAKQTFINCLETPWTEANLLPSDSPNPLNPPRVRACPLGIVACCGMCTKKCKSRCLLDTQSRLNFHYLNLKAVRELQSNPEPGILEKHLTQLLPYEEACIIIEQLISGYHHNRRELKQLGIWENPHKFNYAPRVKFHPGTNKPEIDPATGFVRIDSWPNSGLCPHCLPTTRAYIIKPER